VRGRICLACYAANKTGMRVSKNCTAFFNPHELKRLEF
jgi:hypothetical protein